jgi:hypothetical protein
MSRGAVVIKHGSDLLQGILLSAKKTNMGILLGVAVPRMLEIVARGRN